MCFACTCTLYLQYSFVQLCEFLEQATCLVDPEWLPSATAVRHLAYEVVLEIVCVYQENARDVMDYLNPTCSSIDASVILKVQVIQILARSVVVEVRS